MTKNSKDRVSDRKKTPIARGPVCFLCPLEWKQLAEAQLNPFQPPQMDLPEAGDLSAARLTIGQFFERWFVSSSWCLCYLTFECMFVFGILALLIQFLRSCPQ